MSNKEMRELDVWIAEHVFGWKWNRQGRAFSEDVNGVWIEEKRIPNYSTDPAAAMQVLEKCAEKGSTIRINDYRSHWLIDNKEENNEAQYQPYCGVSGSTLPLAICHLARKLFKKSK